MNRINLGLAVACLIAALSFGSCYVGFTSEAPKQIWDGVFALGLLALAAFFYTRRDKPLT